MAYNPVPTGNITVDKKYLFKVEKLSGGCSANEDKASDSHVSSMTDMYSDGAYLLSRGGKREVCAPTQAKYVSKFSEEYYGNIIFHAGTSLYRFDGENIHVLCENVGVSGFFLRMNAKVYFYSSDKKIFVTDKNFNCTEAEIYAPEIIRNANLSLLSYDAGEPFNMLTRRVRCVYKFTESNPSSTVRFTLPYDLDENEPYYLYSKGTRRNPTGKSYDAADKEVTFRFSTTNYADSKLIVEYAVKNDTVDEYVKKLYGSSIAFCYGGTTKDGTRAFITGNKDYPSMYFRSELKNPLYFPDNAQETLGDGSENVNGAEKRYEKMYFFTDRHIYSMTYSFSEEEGAVYTVNPVNTGVGCDMPGSVKALDNTIVFADKTKGIYILQSTDIFDELNILPISENLKGDTGTPFGKDGTYFSCEHDRKYYICNGKAVYMWDYGAVPFYSGAEYRTSQEKLPWFKISSARDICDMFSLSGKLYFIEGENEMHIYEYSNEYFCDTSYDSENGKTDENVLCSFTTKKYDFGYGCVRKRLINFSFDYKNKSGKDRNVFLTFFADGKLFCTAKARLTEKEGRITVRIPACSAFGYSVKAAFDGGGVGVNKLAFLWRKAERVKYYDQ